MAGRVIGVATVQVKADTDQFRGALDGLGGHIRGMASKLSGVIGALGLGQLARDAISFGGEYRVQLDNASAAISGLVENQEDAATLMSEMTDMAIKTPFSLPGIQDATTRLLAYGDSFGVTSDNVLDWVGVVGDAAASVGKGPDAMLNVITAMGKISGQGRIMTRDMNQITANFPSLHPWEILSEMTGKTEQELRKLATKPGGLSGIVDTTEFLEQLKIGMEEMPGAAGAMERKMGTLGGSFEQFKDAMGVALANGLQPFFDTLIGLMKNPAIAEGLETLIAGFGDLISQVAAELIPILPGLITAFTDIVAALLPAMPIVSGLAETFATMLVALTPVIEVLATFVGWIGKLLSALPPDILGAIAAALATLWLVGFGPMGAIIIGVVLLATAIAQNWDAIMSATEGLRKAIGDAWDWLFEHVLGPIGDFVMAIVDWFQELYDTLVGNSIIPDLVDAIVGWFQKLIDIVVGIFTSIWNVVKAIWEGIKTTVTTVLNVLTTIITTVLNGYATIFSAVFGAIRTAVGVIWDGIKTAITVPIQAARDLAKAAIGAIRDFIQLEWDGLKTIVSGIWNGIKSAITGPIQAAYDFVFDKIKAIKNLVQGAVDAIGKIPGAGAVGSLIGKIPGLAVGGIIDHPTLAVLGERSRREAVIPLTNPGRAMQLMQQTGLDRLAQRGFNGPLVSMPGAVIQDATDADLVAQRTLVAMQAAMVA